MFETLSVKVDQGVGILVLNRPDRHNAVNSLMSQELPRAWEFLEADDAVRVIILTGAGDRSFCSGADLTDLPNNQHAEIDDASCYIRWTGRQNGVTKPVIAVVNGKAIGGGIHFLADADIILMADHSSLVDTHVAVGLVAALEPISLVQRMPLGSVMKLALTGGDERIEASEAYRLGLADEVLSVGNLMPRALELAHRIARHSPTAVARTKAAIWSAKEVGMTQALQIGWDLILRQEGHPDMNEGISAFVEKREPNWAVRGQDDL